MVCFQEYLKDAVIKSDEESERIAEQFLNKEMDLDEFLVAYIQRRMVSDCDIEDQICVCSGGMNLKFY